MTCLYIKGDTGLILPAPLYIPGATFGNKA